jgi:hypothetical protein
MASTFRFTKEIDLFLNIYRVIDNDHIILGEYCSDPDRQYIKCDNKEIEIQTISGFFKKTKYLLIDLQNGNQQIGNFNLLGIGIDYYWKDVPSSPNGTLVLNNVVYNFRRIAPAIRESFLKKDTHGYFRFRLYSVTGTDYAEYDLKMEMSIWKKPGAAINKPFEGTVETNMKNFPVVLAACFLMEYEFRHDGESGGE